MFLDEEQKLIANDVGGETPGLTFDGFLDQVGMVRFE